MLRIAAALVLSAGFIGTFVGSFIGSAWAQPYPDRAVDILVGYAAGSGPDIQARTVAQQLATDLHQPFVVENRTGANGTLAARIVATAQPDGYTLLFSSSSITPTPYIYKHPGYDLLADLRAVATIGISDGLLMLVDASSPIKSVPEFIAYAKTHHVFYGSPGVGNMLHLEAELFSRDAGIKMEHIPYKGASEVMTGLLGGTVQVMFVTPPSVMGLLASGRVRALAYTGTKPFPPYPDIPLMKDVLPGSQPLGSWGMFYTATRTPDAVVNRLNSAIQQALDAPAVAQVMQRDGFVPDHRDAAATEAFFRSEVARMADAVKIAGIAPQ